MMSDGRCPYARARLTGSKIELRRSSQGMPDKCPIDNVRAVVDRKTREVLELYDHALVRTLCEVVLYFGRNKP